MEIFDVEECKYKSPELLFDKKYISTKYDIW
jgi:hypothetical protein